MNILTKIRGYRTVIIQAATMVIGLLVLFGLLPAAQWAGVTPEVAGQYFDSVATAIDTAIGSVMVLLGIVNTWLRLITKGPVGKNDPAE